MARFLNSLRNWAINYLMACTMGIGIALVGFLVLFPISCIFGIVPRWLFWVWLVALIAFIIWRRHKKKKGGTT